MTKTTDFGYQRIPVEQKTRRVGQVFDSVAARYDLMNDLMSWGIHRLWKQFAVAIASIKRGQQVLDLAGGTGDMTARLARRVGSAGSVILADINGSMLSIGRDRLIDQGIAGTVQYVQANAESLPFPDNTFDVVTIAFGLRNVTHKDQALASMRGVLQPGGRVVILEFSQLVMPLLQRLYDSYSFTVLPWLGKLVVGDAESYRYLLESIRRHPGQETLKSMMESAGFDLIAYYNLSGGIAAVHCGYKL
ncbi:MAG TPA: bifunctional demethylmenaquinone methyltransferase/2-methoxy-6-polyprenyl-1,4-benzoquinol methylase UbiE [Gammaproteobacteria bacterium]|nr:bifunctional demethylmenaquinone methyltransferase/2-methoxy-6-polyprenyl-1,4-benzoquinol methylase UbiE [Gammaproteobacteria bacterium]